MKHINELLGEHRKRINRAYYLRMAIDVLGAVMLLGFGWLMFVGVWAVFGV